MKKRKCSRIMTVDSRKSKEFKLVIAVLDNAGKTSALIALRQKYNFYERVKNLKPTIKIATTIIGSAANKTIIYLLLYFK